MSLKTSKLSNILNLRQKKLWGNGSTVCFLNSISNGGNVVIHSDGAIYAQNINVSTDRSNRYLCISPVLS